MKKVLFAVFAILMSNILLAQVNIDTVWTKTIGGTGSEPYGYSFESKTVLDITPSGDIYAVTLTTSEDGYVNQFYGQTDCWLVKMNAEGDTLWTKVFGGTDYDATTDIVALDDEGCVIVGFTYSNDNDFTGNHDADGSYPDGFVTKFSSDGEIEWSRLYGGAGSFAGGIDELNNVIINQAGNIYAVGRSSSVNGDLPLDFTKYMGGWILEVALENGDVINSQKIVGRNHDEYNLNTLIEVRELPEGNEYIAIGEQVYSLPSNPWLVKINSDADSVWTKEFTGSGEDNFLRGIEIDQDGNYIIADWVTGSGGDITTSYGEQDIWILKTSPEGEELAQVTFGGSSQDAVTELRKDHLGNFMISGITRSEDYWATGTNYGESDFWLINFNSDLDTVFTFRAGGTDVEKLTSAVSSNDGEFIYVAGRTNSNDGFVHGNNGGTDAWIAKISRDDVVNIQNPENAEIEIYPNPATDFLTFKNIENQQISIYNFNGQKVLSTKITAENSTIDISQLNAGIYLLKSDDGKTQKFIKM